MSRPGNRETDWTFWWIARQFSHCIRKGKAPRIIGNTSFGSKSTSARAGTHTHAHTHTQLFFI